jgi:hypothetical protein
LVTYLIMERDWRVDVLEVQWPASDLRGGVALMESG